MERKYVRISLIVLFIISLIVFVGKVHAEDFDMAIGLGGFKERGKIGDTVKIEGGSLRARDDVFCIEHRGDFHGGTYTVYDVIDFNGKRVVSEYSGKSRIGNEHATMAYLFCKGSYSKKMYYGDTNYMSARNIAIWAYQNTWLGSFANGELNRNWKHDEDRHDIDHNFSSQNSTGEKAIAQKLLDEAKKYGESNIVNAKIEVTGDYNIVEKTNYNNSGIISIYGPFKIKYTGNLKIKAFDQSDNEIKNDIWFCTLKAGGNVNNKNDYTNLSGISAIESDTNFYIKVKNKKLKNVKCSVESTVIKGKVFFLADSTFWNNDGQCICIVDLKEELEKDSVDFNSAGAINIYKRDDKERDKDLEGAYFKIYKASGTEDGKGKNHGWLRGYSTYSYKENMCEGTEYRMEEAKDNNHKNTDLIEYTTNSEGKKVLKIKGLSRGTYRIYEVKTPNSKYKLENQKGYGKKTETVNGVEKITEFANMIEFKIPEDNNAGIAWTLNRTIYNTKETIPSGIIISKKDKKTNEALEGAEFIIHRDGKGWIKNKIAPYEYTNSIKNAAKFVMNGNNGSTSVEYNDTKKELTIELEEGTYQIYETKAPQGYDLSKQEGYRLEDGVELVDIAIDESGNKDIFISSEEDKDFVQITAYNKQDDEIVLLKRDKDTNKALEGAEFIIQKDGEKWLANNTSPYRYTDNYRIAAKFVMNENNNSDFVVYDSSKKELTIKGLEDGTYHIYETKAPQGYDLLKQEGYNARYNYVDTGKIITLPDSNNNGSKNITIYNKKESQISISGYVWIDVEKTKENTANSLCDNNETKVGGVTVNLIKKGTRNIIATTRTNLNGEYIGQYTFDKVLTKDQLKDYYVEFNYNGVYADGQDISNYIPVDFNSINVNGSRGFASVSGTAATYKGTNETTENQGGLSSNGNLYKNFYNENTETLEYINLGLKKIQDEYDYPILETLKSVKIGIRGYTYEYEYGKEGNTNSVLAPIVNWQGKYAYSRDIYPSDIVYRNEENPSEELKVEVTYRINIRNTDEYDDLYITELTNTYDTNRYTLVQDKNWELKYDDSGKEYAFYNKAFDNPIAPRSGAPAIYITFNVKKDELLRILANPNGIIENNPTEATSVGHYEYYIREYNEETEEWEDVLHKTSNIEHSDDAPFLVFRLGEERTVSGKVFEDKVVSKNGEKLGDGMYGEGDEVIPGVKVELLDADITKLPVSRVYPKEKVLQYKINIPKIYAVTYSDTEGNYSFKGLVPGNYYLRFTYGSGETKVTDIEGNEIEARSINAKDYKSTIVKDSKAVTALKGGTDFEWYKKLESKNASVAVDNLSERKAVNEENKTSAMAGTAKIFISLEDTRSFAKVFDGLNFGIIEQPKQDSEIEKIITNVRLTNSQGNVLYNGNPENVPSQTIVSISDLDNKQNGGSTYVRAEIAEDSLYGTELELTYEVRITNTSDINYYYDYYYWFGEYKRDGNGNKIKEVTLTPKDVRDYLDKTLKYDAEKSEKLDAEKSDKKHKIIEEKPNELETITIDGVDIKAQEFKLTEWKAIYTNKNKERKEEDTKDIVTIVANRKLSKDDDDMEITSWAEIKEIEHTPDPADKINSEEEKIEQVKVAPKEVHTNGMVKATSTVTPPTGIFANTTIFYAIAGVISLIILSTGIVIIKKKIA